MVGKTRTIDVLLGWAKDRRLNQAEVAKKMGVSKQMLTNWKRRGMPAAYSALAAQLIGCTVDALLAGAVGQASGPVRVMRAHLEPDARDVAADWQQLREPMRSCIRDVITMLVAAQIRADRGESWADKAPKAPAVAHDLPPPKPAR